MKVLSMVRGSVEFEYHVDIGISAVVDIHVIGGPNDAVKMFAEETLVLIFDL